MDGRDRVIGTQVAFKGAVDLCRELDLTTAEGQQQFGLVFTYLQDSLVMAMSTDDATAQAAQVIRGNFPGTTTEYPQNQQAQPQQQWPQQQQMPVPNGYPQQQLHVKGDQFGPLPDWLFQAAAAKGVVEVYDNRNKAMGTKRPWFRSTSGGDDAPAFWPPKS